MPEIKEENSVDDEADDTQSTGVEPETAHDKVNNKTIDDNNDNHNDKDDGQEKYMTKYGRVICPYDEKNEYSGIYYTDGNIPK